jgi:hypothetical protein
LDFLSFEGICTAVYSILRKEHLPFPSVILGTVMKTAVDNRSLSDYYAMPHLYAPFLRSLLSEMHSLFMIMSEVTQVWQKQENCGKERKLNNNAI